MDLTDAHYYY